MEIFLSDGRSESVPVEEDALAAAVAAIRLYLGGEQLSYENEVGGGSAWSRAARLEGQGISLRPQSMAGRWRI